MKTTNKNERSLQVIAATGVAISIPCLFIDFLLNLHGKPPTSINDLWNQHGFDLFLLLALPIALCAFLMSVDSSERMKRINHAAIYALASIFGGIVFYLVILWVQPRPFFTDPPHDAWWSALAILVTLVFAVAAISYFREKTFHDLEQKCSILEERIENFEEVTSQIWQIYSPEGKSSAQDWNDIVRVMDDFPRKDRKSTLLRSLSCLAWEQNCSGHALLLRLKAIQLDGDDCWNRLYLANMLIEGGAETELEKIESLIPTNKTHMMTNPQLMMFRTNWAKFHMNKGDFEKARSYFEQAIGGKEKFDWPTVMTSICMLCSGRGAEIENLIAGREIQPSDAERDIIRVFRDMILVMISKNTIDKFYANFSPLKGLLLSPTSSYERWYLPNIWKHLERSVTDEGVRNTYLVCYHFFGVGDKDATDVLADGKREKILEEKLLQSWR